jgi:hypothetical protein
MWGTHYFVNSGSSFVLYTSIEMAATLGDSKGQSCPAKWTVAGNVIVNGGFTVSNGETGQSEITFDYGQAVGGMPFIETKAVTSSGGPVEVDIVFSETFEGLQTETGMYSIAGIGHN